MTTLFIDIETVPQGWEQWGPQVRDGTPPLVAVEAVLRGMVGQRPPKNYGPEAAAGWWARKLPGVADDASAWYRKRSVDPKYGQILCLGYALNDQPVDVIWGYGNRNRSLTERTALQALEAVLVSERPTRIVAWRGRIFDFPFIWERAVGYRMHEVARHFATPHYGASRVLDMPVPPARLIDPHDLWSTTYESAKTLWAVASYLGVLTENPITGAGVLDAMLDGTPEIVDQHVRADVLDLRGVWEALAPALGVGL